eukprot:11367861-Heterocapsa_arctica.AAC.1
MPSTNANSAHGTRTPRQVAEQAGQAGQVCAAQVAAQAGHTGQVCAVEDPLEYSVLSMTARLPSEIARSTKRWTASPQLIHGP